MAARTRKRGRPRKKGKAPSRSPGAPAPAGAGGLSAALARGLGALTGGVRGTVAATPGIGLQVGRRLLLSREAARMRLEAGRTLRELRELAGLTVDELARALDLRDRTLLEAVEAGTATLSFELILRLSALVARNDPIPFVAQMARGSNPALWSVLEDWGVGRIPLQLERERRFLNLFRGHDVARELSDEGFERVLAFLRTAFELALGFVAEQEGLAPRGRRRRAVRRPARRQKV
ncbi:MAG: XRE family transcriptional regulator [Deltaproteobacteria bacterium]|nr:XRE family transcriptional regulator [Deltaproteobacteria bacterium]